MAETYYRILNEDIIDTDDIVLNHESQRVLTGRIHEYDFHKDGKLIPCVSVLSRYWYRIPLSCFKEGIVEQFTN